MIYTTKARVVLVTALSVCILAISTARGDGDLVLTCFRQPAAGLCVGSVGWC